jgi:hypothetical protein
MRRSASADLMATGGIDLLIAQGRVKETPFPL